jgi:hypothetical protein
MGLKVREHGVVLCGCLMCAILTHTIFCGLSKSRQATAEQYEKFYRDDEKLFFHSYINPIQS